MSSKFSAFLGLTLVGLTLTLQKAEKFFCEIEFLGSIFLFFHQMKNNFWLKMINAPPLFFVWKDLLF